MKKLLLIAFVLYVCGVSAQDTITMKNGDTITGKVQLVSDDYIQIINGTAMTLVPESGVKLVRFENSDSNSIYVDRVDINGMDNEFIQIIGYQKGWLGEKVIVNIDYGQKTSNFGRRNQLIADNLGRVIEFHSMIDALNYLTKHGWVYVDNFPMSSSQGSAYHYLLRRKRD